MFPCTVYFLHLYVSKFLNTRFSFLIHKPPIALFIYFSWLFPQILTTFPSDILTLIFTFHLLNTHVPNFVSCNFSDLCGCLLCLPLFCHIICCYYFCLSSSLYTRAPFHRFTNFLPHRRCFKSLFTCAGFPVHAYNCFIISCTFYCYLYCFPVITQHALFVHNLRILAFLPFPSLLPFSVPSLPLFVSLLFTASQLYLCWCSYVLLPLPEHAPSPFFQQWRYAILPFFPSPFLSLRSLCHVFLYFFFILLFFTYDFPLRSCTRAISLLPQRSCPFPSLLPAPSFPFPAGDQPRSEEDCERALETRDVVHCMYTRQVA